MGTDAAFGFPTGTFFILPLLSFVLTMVVIILAVVVLWRIMKAQEATAAALSRIAASFERRSA